MCNSNKFFICRHCRNIVGIIHNSGVPLVCCGEKMQELVPNTIDASKEKHVPVWELNNGKITVKIGSTAHPMLQEHHIEWIYVQTENGGQRRCLQVGAAPEAVFDVFEDKPVAVYAYCNLHGLWKAEL